jgi:hypothetical protein
VAVQNELDEQFARNVEATAARKGAGTSLLGSQGLHCNTLSAKIVI